MVSGGGWLIRRVVDKRLKFCGQLVFLRLVMMWSLVLFELEW